jgi:secreted trypsin-like serine protease
VQVVRPVPSTRWLAVATALIVALVIPAVSEAQTRDLNNPPDGRIVGGAETNIGTFPWQAAMVLDQAFGQTDRVGCGGTFLTSRIVQTAAHCVVDTDPDCTPAGCITDPGGDGTPFADFNDFDIIGGRTQLSNEATGQQINIQVIFALSAYSPSPPENDLAWVVLATPHSQTTIDVAGPAERAFWDANSPTMVSGWGHTSEGGSSSDILKQATVPVIPDPTCATPAVYQGVFNPANMLCAGHLAGGTDSCQGDSGGPLVGPSTIPGQVRLVGVVSWGIGCADPNKPGVYARIADPAAFNIQGLVDQIESMQGLPDGGSVVGDGSLTAAPNIGGAPPKKCKKKKKKGKKKSASTAKKKKCKKKKKKKKKKRSGQVSDQVVPVLSGAARGSR